MLKLGAASLISKFRKFGNLGEASPQIVRSFSFSLRISRNQHRVKPAPSLKGDKKINLAKKLKNYIETMQEEKYCSTIFVKEKKFYLQFLEFSFFKFRVFWSPAQAHLNL